MYFDDFIKSKKVIICEKDFQKAKALVKMSDDSIKFVSSLNLDNKSSTVILVNYYEAIRQILEAMCLVEGYKVFSHEAYTYYLKKLKENSIAEKFDRLRKLRNGANYYGKPVSKEVTQNAKKDIDLIKQHLIKTYLKKF
ncbi:MAG: hypothetical protein KKF89_06370 [Nanoarchaeota archaeon]|nr:hypothetical protein [Nanoarchaeota archaeon]MBU1855323.1 hypothetical protein [Nanoarchaeota archaeon]